MLNENELNWMSENANELKAARLAAMNVVYTYVREADGATATVKNGRVIDLSIPEGPSLDGYYETRIGVTPKVLRENGFVRVEK